MIFDIKYCISKFCDKKTRYILRRIDTEFKYIIDKQIFQDCIYCKKKTLVKKCKTCKKTFCFDCFTICIYTGIKNDKNKNSKYCSECFIGYCDLCENEIQNVYGNDIHDLDDEDHPHMGCSVQNTRDYYSDKFLKKCGNIICNECKTDCVYCRTCIDCEVKCISCNACTRCVDFFCEMCGICSECTDDFTNDCETCKESTYSESDLCSSESKSESNSEYDSELENESEYWRVSEILEK